MNPSRAARLALAAVALVVVVALCWLAESRAQETELPSVSADSVSDDFLKGPGGTEIVGGQARDIELPNHIRISTDKDDVVEVGQDIVIERNQQVLGHVLAMGGNITIRGVVDDDVVAMGGDVILEDGAQVRGDAVSVGGRVRRSGSATVLGSTVSVGSIPKSLFALSAFNMLDRGMKFVGSLFSLLFLVLITWAVVSLTKSRTARIVAEIERATLASLGWGLLALIAVVPASIVICLVAVLLVVTIIGIPVAVLALLGYIVGLVLLAVWGSIVGATALGGWMVRRLTPRLGEPTLVRNAIVGVVAISLPGLLGHLFQGFGPVVPPALVLGGALEGFGKLLGLCTLLAGVGGILRARAGQPAPLPGAFPSAPVPPHVTHTPPGFPGTGAPEAAPPTA